MSKRQVPSSDEKDGYDSDSDEAETRTIFLKDPIPKRAAPTGVDRTQIERVDDGRVVEILRGANLNAPESWRSQIGELNKIAERQQVRKSSDKPFGSVNPDAMNNQDKNNPPQAANQSKQRARNNNKINTLSYHQQQQIHQIHFQRAGGLQRLTADLAGIQFNDADAFLQNLQTPSRSQKPAREQRGSQKSRRKQVKTATTSSPQTAEPSAGQTQADKTLGLEEQPVSNVELTPDPVKEAQETAEDAALLKRFKLTQLLGTGNYSRVYKGITCSGREVAIKSINLTKSSENYIKKFLPRELSILKRVYHVNVCRTLEILQISDRIFILMQFCERGTIADLLFKCGAFSESVSRYLFGQTLDALIYLHNNDIAHRDVKIENILLTGDFVAKLTDFSYSVCLTDPVVSPSQASKRHHSHVGPKEPNTQAGGQRKSAIAKHSKQNSLRLNDTFCGTLPYLAPEVIRLASYDAKKTDIWSLGICLFVMLNDRLPFPFHDVKSMVRKQLTRDFKFKANVNFTEQLIDIVNQMLEPDSNRRLSSVELSRHPWMNGPKDKPVIN